MPITEPDPSCLEAKELTSGATTPIISVVAVALIDSDDRILVAQRPKEKIMGGLWEFPGGKVKEGETPEIALIREIREELGIDIAESCLAPFSFVTHSYNDFNLLLLLYICRVWRGIPTALEKQNLKWVRLEKFGTYSMPPADIPLVAMLREFL